jgi:hypothetical protein
MHIKDNTIEPDVSKTKKLYFKVEQLYFKEVKDRKLRSDLPPPPIG